ncbi:hypothetical protein L596_017015 [Steinernema carpocapsae]|uniref:Uncharacterized protein n=1 Tax=Steinernema carpocapsae TaxID=34508 RepID=A0A4U5N160_STECR|nr:hypothetical protein L596_017015 [Steinernema carpocapsae]
MPVDWLVKECGQIFGDAYDSSAVYTAIEKTNAFYGGVAGFNTSRVIFPNGNHDPWSALGNLHSQNLRSPSIVIDGTAHCGDMYVEADDDLPSLKKARKLIERHMTAWMYH